MPRLRTTFALSLLMLAGGIAGTAWLSDRTAGWHGPAPRVATTATQHLPRAHITTRRQRQPVPPVRGPIVADAAAATAASSAPLTLTPVEMPWPERSWFDRRPHYEGRVVLDVDVDGGGHVMQAAVAESSGQGDVDAEALAVVKGWRFGVPPGHPEGARGQVVWRAMGP